VGRATGPLAGSEARRLRPLNVLVKPELTRNDWAAWGQAGVNGASTKKGCCPCPVGESASGLTSLPDTGRSRAGGGVPRPSPIRAVTAGALTGSLGRFSFESLRRSGSAENGRAGRAARRSSLEAPRPHGFSPMRVSSWSGGRDSMGCLGEARGLIGGALSSLPAGRPPARGTPIPQGRREGEESPADAADRPRPESAAPGGSTGDDQPVGARTTVKPVKPCPHIHAHPPPCPQSPLTARVQLRDG